MTLDTLPTDTPVSICTSHISLRLAPTYTYQSTRRHVYPRENKVFDNLIRCVDTETSS